MADGDYRRAAPCARCGNAVVAATGDVCESCQTDAERAALKQEWDAVANEGNKKDLAQRGRTLLWLGGSFAISLAICGVLALTVGEVVGLFAFSAVLPFVALISRPAPSKPG